MNFKKLNKSFLEDQEYRNFLNLTFSKIFRSFKVT